ncbi:endonuclease III [Candidatus Sneabacter namystus]|uniref:Endonuclease III n=1 Tax=Candidatus Sneabacter namystus TaxID=2601646 RepID=A0A5C0UI98_9RICK|nr:endonuclease III [Candidatus Sneabacter namystus]QEK39487.1 endonuclease III [Candidatus Sneabacter namystus]
MNDRLFVTKILDAWRSWCANPTIELDYKNHFTLLVAIVLSARATDVGVNKATHSLFEMYSTPREFIKLGEENLSFYVKTIGLYRTKAKNILKMSHILESKYDGQVPSNFEDLVQLPGVGRKSANVFLNNAYGAQTMPVDTHVFRVARRIGWSDATTVLGVERDLVAILPKKCLNHANNWLVLHGRYVCKARKPNCTKCLINKYCKYYNESK